MAGRTPSVIKGADLKVFVNNRIFGIVTSFSWRISTGRKPAYGIDNPEPFEIPEGATSITGNMQILRLRLDGGLEGYGVIAQHDKLTVEKYISIAVVERFTDRVVFQTDRAIVLEQQWNVDSRAMLTGSFSFQSIGWSNDF